MALLPIDGGGSSVTAVFNNRFDWVPGVLYKQGDTCTVAGIRQICRSEHLSTATPDLSKWSPTEGTDGFATTVVSAIVSSANKPTSAGIHVFLVTPSDGLPAGSALGDLCYYNGVEWSVFRTYNTAPSVFQVGGAQWYKYKNTWAYDTEWLTHNPTVTVYSGTPPTLTGVTAQMKYRLRGGMLEGCYHRTGSASATGGSGNMMFSMPSDVRIDTSVAVPNTEYLAMAPGSNARTKALPIGVGSANSNGDAGNLLVFTADENKFYFEASVGGGLTKITSNVWFAMTESAVTLCANMQIPIKRSWEA